MTSTTALPKQEEAKFAKPKGDERKRLKLARTALIIHNPFFGLLAMRLELVEATWIITAGTDGKRFFYNPWYISPLTDAQLRGLWGHEVMHCSNGHLWRRSGREANKFNWACDYAIDPILKESGLAVPNETINPTWKGMAAEQIYAIMPEPPKMPQPQGGYGQGQGQGKGGEGEGEGDGQGSGGDPRAPKFMPGKDVLLEPDQADAKQQQAAWNQATLMAAKVAKAQGKLPSNLETLITEWTRPRVSWKDVLRRLVQQTARADYSWRRPADRHAARGIYMPRLESEQVPPLAIGWDTSGSHWAQETQQAVAAEVLGIMDEVHPEKIVGYFFDSIVQGKPFEWEPGDPFNPKPKGGGGTDFCPVFERIEKDDVQPAALIMVTDCYGSFPETEPPYPVIWASTVDPDKLPPSCKPPFGEVVFVDLDEDVSQ